MSMESNPDLNLAVISRATTEQCPFAILVMGVQSIVGVIIQACMAGIIFAKFTVPRKRGETIIFSKNMVISMRNGALFLMCRISDIRKYSLLEAHVRMVLVHDEITSEGEQIPYQQTELLCGSGEFSDFFRTEVKCLFRLQT